MYLARSECLQWSFLESDVAHALSLVGEGEDDSIVGPVGDGVGVGIYECLHVDRVIAFDFTLADTCKQVQQAEEERKKHHEPHGGMSVSTSEG